ncbi:MAG: pilus assembly protein [Clostridiaceae bacterium]|nr:pilus assembly protein [Clostridiaceae bacterium]
MKWKRDGSYTVEAAFVFPLVLGVCFVILYTLFWLHDRVVLQGNLNGMLVLAAEGELSRNEKSIAADLEKTLWCMEITELKIQDGLQYEKCVIRAKSQMEIPVMSIFVSGLRELTLEEKYPCRHPEYYRRYRDGGE